MFSKAFCPNFETTSNFGDVHSVLGAIKKLKSPDFQILDKNLEMFWDYCREKPEVQSFLVNVILNLIHMAFVHYVSYSWF